jgi:hypothetical protein
MIERDNPREERLVPTETLFGRAELPEEPTYRLETPDEEKKQERYEPHGQLLLPFKREL